MSIEEPITTSYNPVTTAQKAAVPIVVMVGVEVAAALLPKMGVDLGRDLLYQIGILAYSGFLGFTNWLKNKHK
jgi:hypothetical protein